MGQPPAGGNGGGAGRSTQRFPRASAPSNSTGELLLRAHAGFGEFAVLDPASGVLRGVPMAGSAVSGVYAELDAIRVLFYRDHQVGLVLRIADQVIPVDRLGAEAGWERGQGFHRLWLQAGGNVLCDLRYAPMAPDSDLGMLIRDVLADPGRRAGIFG